MLCALFDGHDRLSVGADNPTLRAMTVMHTEEISILDRHRCCGRGSWQRRTKSGRGCGGNGCSRGRRGCHGS